MARSTDRLPQFIFYLAASFISGAVFLRTLLVYQSSPDLRPTLGLLLIWLALAASEPTVSRRWPGYFLIYLTCQTVLVFGLMTMPGSPDFFAILLAVLSMQVMLHFDPRVGALWIGICALVLALLLAEPYGTQTIAFVLVYTGANVFLGSYALAIQRAQAARVRNQALVQQLEEGNRQLQVYSAQLEGMAVARERNRLARELHDSVTQTVFSMNLTVQSARLLFARDHQQVNTQLERLSQLSQNALSEMQLLISELRPEKIVTGGLVSALRRFLLESRFPASLSISLKVEGDGTLESAEEQSLFRIAQEALNNIVKHARASHARVRLHLTEPFWVEIEDQGRGFDLQQAQNCSRVGLVSMRERAAEIGWELQIFTSPGTGTRIRVDKLPVEEVWYDITQ